MNEQTRSAHTLATPTWITGWIRQWKHCADTPFGKICALTVARRENSTIHGVLIQDETDKIAEVDRREIGYRREGVEIQDERVKSSIIGMDTFIYVSTQEYNRWGNAEFPIYQSYLDCVLAGYLKLWGRDGAANFIATTEGWYVPILNDRSSPKYPRAVQLSEIDRCVIDELLKESPRSR